MLGFGLGGFFDGIVLHQILQWHHLMIEVYPVDTLDGLELNTLWDGIFHITMYVITLVGLVMLWHAMSRRNAAYSPRTIIGAVLIGFGVFHLFDSVLNHWILEIHHICYEPSIAVCDGGYFVVGLVLIGLGWLIGMQAAPRERSQRPSETER